MNAFLVWLDAVNAQILDREHRGQNLMAVGGPEKTQEYTELMRQKAEVLAGLYDSGVEIWEQLPADERARVEKIVDVESTLEGLSSGARNALRLNSVFYMSALLYPDDHQVGQPNNLELFVAKVHQAF